MKQKINNFADKEFKVMVTKMFTGRMGEHSEKLQQRDRKYKKVLQAEVTELKNIITPEKYTRGVQQQAR